MSQWMVTYDKLDDEQLQFINVESKKNTNYWINGFAGSGKSVLLIHALDDFVTENPNSVAGIVVFTHALKHLFLSGLKTLNITNRNVVVMTYYELEKTARSFDIIFCDEVQDLPASKLTLMKERAKKVIVAGDANQSIYPQDPIKKEKTVNYNEIELLLNAKAWSLQTIYRLPKSIIQAVSSFLPSMNILSAKKDVSKKDVQPVIVESPNKEKEVAYIYQKMKEAHAINNSVVVLLPTHEMISEFVNYVLSSEKMPQWQPEENKNRWGKTDYNNLNQHLVRCKTNLEYIGNNFGSLAQSIEYEKMAVMTYHSAKGLDFDQVFLPFMNMGSNFPFFSETLFMVGMTRSKFSLTISYSGTMHPFLKRFEKDCIKIDSESISSGKDEIFDDFDF